MTGNTKKYANAMPIRKNTKLETITGTASRFSCWYSPGATNAHIWYSTYGQRDQEARPSA